MMCDCFACIEWIQQRPFIIIAFLGLEAIGNLGLTLN